MLNLDTNSTFVSRDVKFYESVFPFKINSSLPSSSESAAVHSRPWDPFSYDDSDLSDYMNDSLDLDDLRVVNPIEGASGDHSNRD